MKKEKVKKEEEKKCSCGKSLKNVPHEWRSEDDGRCLHCEGWGCCACGHTGGY